MTPRERRGKWLFVILATLITLDKFAGIGLSLSGGLHQIKWWQSVVLPLCVVSGVILLRDGDNWLRWLMGVALVFSSGARLVMLGRLWFALAGGPEPNRTEYAWQLFGLPLGVIAIHQGLYLLAGLALLVSPSLRAYFAHRRSVRRLREWVDRFVVTSITDVPAEEVEPDDQNS